jgi:hypothetical protein
MLSRPFELTTYPWVRTQMRLVQRATPPALRYGLWAGLAIMALWLALCFVAPQIGMVFGDLTPLYVGLVGFVGFFVFIRRRNAIILHHANRSVFRDGPWQIKIDEAGLQVTGAGAQTLFLWNHLTEVLDHQDGLLVMSGPSSFVPVPGAAFANDADRLAFRHAVEARIAATRGAR